MNDQVQGDYTEIDILKLLRALWKKAWLIAISMAVAGVLCLSYAAIFVTPQYKSTAMMYVNNSSISEGAASFTISEMNAAKSLLDIYVIILESRATLEEVIEQADLDYTYPELNDMVEAASVNDTEVFRITATSPDPEEAERIVDTIVEILPDRIADIVDGSSVRVVDNAVRPTVRSSPSYTRYAVIGVVLGAVISCVAVVVLELLDTTVRDEDYLRRTFGLPVLAVVPVVYASRKSACKTCSRLHYRRPDSETGAAGKNKEADSE